MRIVQGGVATWGVTIMRQLGGVTFIRRIGNSRGRKGSASGSGDSAVETGNVLAHARSAGILFARRCGFCFSFSQPRAYKKRPKWGVRALKSGGELGIRTPDTLWGVYSLSRRAPSASRSALRRRRLTRLVILPLAARTCKKRVEVHNFAARLPAARTPCEGDTPRAISRSAFAIGGSIF